MRKRSKSREAGLNRVSAVDIGLDEQATSESQKTKLEFEHRLSLGGKGQLNDQRGLLNKEDLVSIFELENLEKFNFFNFFLKNFFET